MGLSKEFQRVIDDAQTAHDGRAKLPALHQVVIGADDTVMEQMAREYARELIQRGIVGKVPVELNCRQPMSDDMVQQAFRDAKGGILVVTHLESLAREETFVSLAIRNINEKKLAALILCGTDEGVKQLLVDNLHLRSILPAAVNMGDGAVLDEIAAHDQHKRDEELKTLTDVTLQNPVTAMKPLSFAPKTPEK